MSNTQDTQDLELEIHFEDVKKRIKGYERQGKLLKYDSALVKFLTQLRSHLDRTIAIEHLPDKPLHIRLIEHKKNISKQLLRKRAQQLEGTPIVIGFNLSTIESLKQTILSIIIGLDLFDDDDDPFCDFIRIDVRKYVNCSDCVKLSEEASNFVKMYRETAVRPK
jgi:hypothetical protein